MKYILKKANNDDIDKLNDIHRSWEHYVEIHGEELEENHFYTSINEGDTPPIKNAFRDKFYIYLIYQGDILIGFIEMYSGYPNEDDLWISLFEIDEKQRRLGHGKNIITQIEMDISKYNCKNLALAVDLKNYRGLKFWTNIGFKEIIGVIGDDNYAKDNFARMALRKKIIL